MTCTTPAGTSVVVVKPHVRLVCLSAAAFATQVNSTMSLKVYLDPISQPCRAVQLLLEANKVPYEKVLLQLRAGTYGCTECPDEFRQKRTSLSGPSPRVYVAYCGKFPA